MGAISGLGAGGGYRSGIGFVGRLVAGWILRHQPMGLVNRDHAGTGFGHVFTDKSGVEHGGKEVIGSILSGIVGVIISLCIALALLRIKWHIPLVKRGAVGLGLTVLHLILSMGLPLVIWGLFRPENTLAFMLSMLAFYLLSLIILVLAIIRWLLTAPLQPTVLTDSKEER